MLKNLLRRATGAAGRASRARGTTGTGTSRPGSSPRGGTRGKDEAIGRGVRGLLRRVR